MRSADIRSMTVRDVASKAVSGLRVFGSERKATTRRPPRLPVSQESIKNSLSTSGEDAAPISVGRNTAEHSSKIKHETGNLEEAGTLHRLSPGSFSSSDTT